MLAKAFWTEVRPRRIALHKARYRVKTSGAAFREYLRANLGSVFSSRGNLGQNIRIRFLVPWLVCLGANPGFAANQIDSLLPKGVEAVWDLTRAYRETTPTRERICINGLWQWQPAEAKSEEVPKDEWGYFKVPGCWPGITDYMQKDCQTVYRHPNWSSRKLSDLNAAWYQRDVTIPASWSERRIAVRLEYLNSFAVVYVAGARVGEIRFPGGELDITVACRPGNTQRLSLLTIALPLKGLMLSYTDSASAREVKGAVQRRGLCGDVYLLSTPPGPRLTDGRVETSVRRRDCTFEVGLEALASVAQYRLRTRVLEKGRSVKEFTSAPFQGSDVRQGRFTFTEKWIPNRLWDTHTPQNTYAVEFSLLDNRGLVLDTSYSERVGFREFWIEGRDFYLNGTRLFLSAVPLDNAQVSAELATYEAARESLERLKGFGINFVYTHNYGCEPGSYLGFEEVLRAADDVGMLVGFSQPHFSHYEWQAKDADTNNGYARHAEYYVRAAQNHPSVVMYSMSHNATGYNEDMNPDMIDGLQEARDTWALKNSAMALRAEAIVRRLDPGRMVYHHASGNLGSMHPINFYPNFVPIQELSDWFEHWSDKGVKPVFLCEYGAPFTWDWTMYRGWYKGQREFGSAAVPWEFCVAEWNAQFFGDRAFNISEPEKANLRWEAGQFRAGKLWHRWDYPNEVGSSRFEERYPVFSRYLTDNWRAFRGWSVSAISPWEYGHFWKLREGVDKTRRDLNVDWQNLQRPGFSPDYIAERYERMDLAFDRSDWIPTEAAQALIRHNQPLLAFLGGKPTAFTSKDHNFYPGENVVKQLMLINNSRESATCECQWSFALPKPVTGSKRIKLAPGEQKRIPLSIGLPVGLSPGTYELKASVRFGAGEIQADTLTVDVLNRPAKPEMTGKAALFDPKGETGSLLANLGVQADAVTAETDLSSYDLLIIGKFALRVDGLAPDISRVRGGLKVLLFEQSPAVLEKRFGFRVEEYGLRQVFARVPDHPVLRGMTVEGLSDWRGEATILPSRLKYEMRPREGTTVEWCGLPVTRLWRCGNRGNVASVLIEKPARGDFLPILDGGYSLQYSPLLEYREETGLVVFCQIDVTGRTESEPAAELLTRNLLSYVCAWKPSPRREAFYAGDAAGKTWLDSVGLPVATFNGKKLSLNQVLIVGGGATENLGDQMAALGDWLKAGGHLVAVGLDQDEANKILPFQVTTKQGEHISTYFAAPGLNSPLVGVGPADLHNRDPRKLPLVTAGATVVGDGVLAMNDKGSVVFDQMPPWAFNSAKQQNLRRTYRRASFTLSRLLANMGVAAPTPLLARFNNAPGQGEKRWLEGFYVDQPVEWDDPYRFFRW